MSGTESLIAMVETYQRAPTRTLALALDKAFGAPRTFERLEARLRNLPFPASFRPFATYEAEATALRSFEHSLMPGLLQTEEYARAVLSTRPNSTEADIDELVPGRMQRQAALTREAPPPPLLWVLLDEADSPFLIIILMILAVRLPILGWGSCASGYSADSYSRGRTRRRIWS